MRIQYDVHLGELFVKISGICHIEFDYDRNTAGRTRGDWKTIPADIRSGRQTFLWMERQTFFRYCNCLPAQFINFPICFLSSQRPHSRPTSMASWRKALVLAAAPALARSAVCMQACDMYVGLGRVRKLRCCARVREDMRQQILALCFYA